MGCEIAQAIAREMKPGVPPSLGRRQDRAVAVLQTSQIVWARVPEMCLALQAMKQILRRYSGLSPNRRVRWVRNPFAATWEDVDRSWNRGQCADSAHELTRNSVPWSQTRGLGQRRLVQLSRVRSGC